MCTTFGLTILQAVAVNLPQVTTAPLYIRAGKRAHLVMSLDRHESPYASQDGPTRSHRSHGHLERRGNQATNRGSNPPCHCSPARGRKGDQGMRPFPNDGLAICPVGKIHQQISIPISPLPTLHRFLNTRNLTDLQADCALTYAGNNLYLPTSLCQDLPPRAHTGHPRLGHADGTTASPDPLILRRTREHPETVNEDQNTPVNGTGIIIKRGSRQATGPEVPLLCVHTRTETLDKELREVRR